MACTCAPALKKWRDQVNAAYPNRDKASDGCCGDPRHAGIVSDHNPTNGYAHAFDMDEDLRAGLDLVPMRNVLYESRDLRIKYLIYEREIWYVNNGARPRGKYPYSGSNAHLHHLHMSIHTWATFDMKPWFIATPDMQPTPVPQEDEDMPPLPVTFTGSGALFVPRGGGRATRLHDLSEVEACIQAGELARSGRGQNPGMPAMGTITHKEFDPDLFNRLYPVLN